MSVESVGDALGRIHRSLRPAGVVVDLQPLRIRSRVEVRDGDRTLEVGRPIADVLFRSLDAAKAALDAVVRDGHFRLVGRTEFETITHYDSVAEWKERRSANRSAVPAKDRPLFERATRLFKGVGPSAEILVRERARALLLVRSA